MTPAKKVTKKPAAGKFSDFEKAAMKERAAELKAEASRADGEKIALAAINKMPEPDRSMAKKFHALVKASAPSLSAKTWYGMPAYSKADKVVCFFQSGHKYKTRYCTIGFTDSAKLDDGDMWPAGFALKALTSAEEAKIEALLKKAVS